MSMFKYYKGLFLPLNSQTFKELCFGKVENV